MEGRGWRGVKDRPWWDSNPQSLAPEANALSIRPQGLTGGKPVERPRSKQNLNHWRRWHNSFAFAGSFFQGSRPYPLHLQGGKVGWNVRTAHQGRLRVTEEARCAHAKCAIWGNNCSPPDECAGIWWMETARRLANKWDDKNIAGS